MLNLFLKIAFSLRVSLAYVQTSYPNNLCYPATICNTQTYVNSNNQYPFNLYQYGQKSIAGLWVKESLNSTDKQLVMSLNYDAISVYCQKSSIFCISSQVGCFYSQQNWIYLYFERDLQNILEQICFYEEKVNPFPICFRLPFNQYMFINFLQTSTETHDELGYINWQGQAYGLSIKTIYSQLSIHSTLDLLSLINFQYSSSNLNLRIKKKQTPQKVFLDYSRIHSVVNFGSTSGSDSNDPEYYFNDMSMKFAAGQYLTINNFQIQRSCQILFQLSSCGTLEQYAFLTFSDINLQPILKIDIKPQKIILIFPLKQLECLLDVETLTKTVLGFIYQPTSVTIIIVQSNSIIFTYKYEGTSDDILGFNQIKSLTVGSITNSNTNAFNLLNLRIIDGFDMNSSNYCTKIDNSCIMCPNNFYLLDNQCISACPPNYNTDNNRKECIRQCHNSCSTCSVNDPTHCITCSGFRISPPDCDCPSGYLDTDDMCIYVGVQCNDGKYRDQNNQCQICDSNCLTCVQNAITCLSCSPGFILIENRCKCQTNQYLDSYGVCQNCSSNCDSCENSSINCISCNQQKQLTLYQGNCICKTNEYVDSNEVCQPCYKYCLSCTSGLPNSCINCIQLRTLDITRQCKCVDGTYEDENNICQICSASCQTCSNVNSCLTCSINRKFYNLECICNDGYFSNEISTCESIHCYYLVCQKPCKNCLNKLDCLSCNDNYTLISYRCEIKKNQFCGNGYVEQQEQCDDGNNLPNDGCYLCLVEKQWICDKSTPSKCSQAPFMILSYLNQTYPWQYIEITFSQKIKTNSTKSLSTSMNYSFSNLNSDVYNIQNYIIHDVTQELSLGNYILGIQINQMMQEYPQLIVNLNQNVYNENQMNIQSKTGTINLNIPIYTSYTQKQTANTIGQVNQKVNYGLLGVSLISLIMGSSDLMQEILDLLQYQSYLKFINFNYPKNLQMYFSVSDMLSINPILEFLHINQIFSTPKQQQSTQISSGKFSYYQMESDLIFNLNCQFIQIGGLLLIYLLLKALELGAENEACTTKYMNFLTYMDSKGLNSVNRISYRCIKGILSLRSMYSQEGFQNFLYINNWDLLFKVFLFLKKQSFTSFRQQISLFLSIIIILLYLNILMKTLKQRNQFLKLNKKYFEALTLCRTWLFMIFLIVFQNNQILQTVLIALNSFQYLIIIRCSRLLSKGKTILLQISESVILLFTFSSFTYFEDWKSIITQEISQYIAMSQIFLLSLALVAKVAKYIFQSGQMLIQLIKNKLSTVYKQTKNVSPNKLLPVRIERPIVTRRFF